MSLQHPREQRGGAADFVASVVVALSIAAAVIMDRFLGWGEGRWSVLSPAVLPMVLPLLTAWVLVALIEHERGLRSRLLLVAHCASAIALPVALVVLARQGHLLSGWLSGEIATRTSWAAGAFETGIVVIGSLMAVAACARAVQKWFQHRHPR